MRFSKKNTGRVSVDPRYRLKVVIIINNRIRKKSRIAENARKREKKMRWILLPPGIIFREVCNARPSDRIVENSGAQAGRPLDRAAKGAPPPINS